MFQRIRQNAAVFATNYLPVILRDLVGLAAVAAIAYGAWMLHPAAGFIVGGTLVLVGVILASVKGR